MLITALIIGTMIVLTIQSNVDKTDPYEDFVDGTMTDFLGGVPGLKQGEIPPDFELTTLTGDVVKLSDYKGNKVILNFWASWCPPCKAEMPHMQKYYEENRDAENVEILAVNWKTTERTSLANIEKFIDAYGLTFPIPVDQEDKVIDAYRIVTIPTTYMIHTDGTIGYKVSYEMNEDMIKELVEQLH